MQFLENIEKNNSTFAFTAILKCWFKWYYDNEIQVSCNNKADAGPYGY